MPVAAAEAPFAESLSFVEIRCEPSRPKLIDLPSLLIGNPDGSGSWSDDDGSGADISDPSSVDFTGIPSGTYNFTYTVTGTNAACMQDETTVSVIVEDCSCPGVAISSPDPLCNSDGQLDLSTLELNTESGSWSITATPAGANPAQLNGTLFDATGADIGEYTITFTLDEVPANPDCPAEASQTIEVLPNSSAGTGSDIDLCNLDATMVDLFDLLENEDAGGNWSLNPNSDLPDGGAFDDTAGTFAAENHTAGAYLFNYIIPEN